MRKTRLLVAASNARGAQILGLMEELLASHQPFYVMETGALDMWRRLGHQADHEGPLSDEGPSALITEMEAELIVTDLPNPKGVAQRFAEAAYVRGKKLAVIVDLADAHARLRATMDNPSSLLALPDLALCCGELAMRGVQLDQAWQSVSVVDIGSMSQAVKAGERERAIFAKELAGCDLTVVLAGVKMVPPSTDAFRYGMLSVLKTVQEKDVKIGVIFRPRGTNAEWQHVVNSILEECPERNVTMVPYTPEYEGLSTDGLVTLADITIAPGGSTPLTAANAGKVPMLVTSEKIRPWHVDDTGAEQNILVRTGAATEVAAPVNLMRFVKQDDAHRRMARLSLLRDKPLDPARAAEAILTLLG